ncbi:LysM peptidoglycan-binding domain-containing protein [Microbacterium sp. H1-D42]|uniref:LysM peptidoglycan-binding domain-containing protein n=1 Tax=Microbacterium sp. H1-D42 TaxID=2925844 RepID=UPI001F5374FB|nr:LysM peptidoglycan-binding domain-containing protein [Microbacterium sp. H1-D42]UNK72001.1 LysM peptidoglycan-binding domain-containing protein [Microbacterium sp. H1-D42]
MSTIGISAPMTTQVAVYPIRPVNVPAVKATRLRLTTRGRRVLLAIAALPIVIGIAVSVIAGGSALASGAQAAPVSFETVTVLPGDTLWSIAAEVAPEADPRVVIEDVKRLNNLSSGLIQVGSDIAIPVAYAN